MREMDGSVEEVVTERILKECMASWRIGSVSDNWTEAAIIVLHKGKPSKIDCKSYREKGLLSMIGKVQ